MKKILLGLLFSITALGATFTTLKVGDNAPITAGSSFEVKSTALGVLFPRMTTSQRQALTISDGLVVYDTNLGRLCIYSSVLSSWECPYSGTPLAVNSNRIMISSGGSVVENSALTANRVVITDSNGLPSTELALSTTRGGTASNLALTNRKILVSTAGSVVENPNGTLTASTPMRTDTSGYPTTGATTLSGSDVTGILPVANGGTNTSSTLFSNRVIISSGGSIGESPKLGASSPMKTDTNGLPTTGTISLTADVANVLPVANGGTNSSTGLNSNRFIISSGGAIVENSALTASRVVITDSNGLPSTELALSTTRGGTASNLALTNRKMIVSTSGYMVENPNGTLTASTPMRTDTSGYPTTGATTLSGSDVTGVLPVANGGTNQAIALNGNRFVVSSGGSIHEMAALGASLPIITDANGLPTTETTLSTARGGTNSSTALLSNMVMVSSAGKIVELSTTGTSGQLLTSNGGGALPTWQAASAGTSTSYPGECYNCGLSASVSANTLTINLTQNDGSSDPSVGNPLKIGFRNVTATTGGFVERTISSALSIGVMAGASLGLLNATNQYVYVWALDSAGTIELAVSGQGVASNFGEQSVQSTSSMSASATSYKTLYSKTARTNVPFRLLGTLLVNETSTQSWTSAPSEIGMNQLEPIAASHVVSDSTGVTGLHWAKITNGGTCVVASQDGKWVTQISHPTTGECDLVFATNTFSAGPTCTCTLDDSSNTSRVCNASSSTTTTMNFYVQNFLLNPVDVNFNIICIGPK